MSGGIAAIESRIMTIQSRFAPVTSAGGALGTVSDPSTADAAGMATGGTAFDDAMRTALGNGTNAGGGTTQGSMSAASGGWSARGINNIAGLDPLAGARTPAARLSSYGKLQPPPELVAYGNGKIPRDALSEIGHGSHRLHAPAARAFRQMEAAAKADGVTIGVTDSYRSYEAQVDVARRKGLYSQGGLAATPGTSNHGWGLAVDLDLDAKALAWMRQNGPDFGFVEDTPREPWHWGYRPIA